MSLLTLPLNLPDHDLGWASQLASSVVTQT